MSQIAAFFNPKNKRLCGLEFTYRDNQVKRGGYTEGTKAILKVKSHEKVTGASSSVSATTVDGGVDIVSVSSLYSFPSNIANCQSSFWEIVEE